MPTMMLSKTGSNYIYQAMRPIFQWREIILKKLILASASPRRADILRAAGVDFAVEVCPLEEEAPAFGGVRYMVASLARQKAQYVAKQHKDGIVLGADTTVCLDGECLGKPCDADDARRMLRALSGRAHSVYSGVCLIDAARGREVLFVRESKVYFSELSQEWIENYIASGVPMDKAGAYAIQGGAAEVIDHFDGDYNNIVGLPVDDVLAYLKTM